jgi:TolB-like protein/tetratricopeptide (TPR) repeat protein
MKRCPECRRDYYDDSLLYCLDDGSALLEGPASGNEPATAILSGVKVPLADNSLSEPATRAQIHTAAFKADPPENFANVSETNNDRTIGPAEPRGKNKLRSIYAAAALLIFVLAGGFFGYRYYASTNSKQIGSIAVMPFANDSGNADVEYLSDGMTETLIKSLSQVPNLAVKSRSTVFHYKGKETSPKNIGDELGVQAVLLGRVAGRGDELKLSLELVNTVSQDVIWTETYDRKRSDLLSLQSEIATDVSTKLKTKLSGADEAKVSKAATVDPDAYEAFLRGRYYWNRRTGEDLQKAVEQFKAATDHDPNYALAYAGLADCYAVLPQYAGIANSDVLPQLRANAERAIALDSQLAEPHAALGAADRMSWQWAEAEREYKRAIELNPNQATIYQWYGDLLKSLGRFDESVVMIRRARELDPLSSIIGINISEMYQIQHDHQASIENSLKIELDPNFSLGHDYLGLSYLKLGRNDEGLTSIQKAVELAKRDSNLVSDLGYAYALCQKRPEALAVIKELEENYKKNRSNGLNIAEVYLALGDKDKAFEWLEKDMQKKEDVSPVRFYTMFETLRDDSRYYDLLKRMGLSE